ncbi:LuxR family transcriptional regulator [Nostocaceae cyanobacterium CENA357]|uniref:LuxR family transcriptional regulator n=1 Tax=Atlanticothrix silvestris CENA357 TaxID=1725252 RepID=A0A8J7L4U3_9CYAN|nr:LuxR C-terminal-related transcriptional regulator [Atlanticothrix silvestris]MBH8553967.1 LuxR family transcriptional regulator [Atlanticothrix silvestris CENA357]
MITLAKTSANVNTVVSPKRPSVKLRNLQQAEFLQEILEGLGDGILILTAAGELVHANASAYHICCQLNQGHFDSNSIPSTIWHLCQSLLDSQRFLSDPIMMLSDEIVLDKLTIFRIRVRFLDLETFDIPCLLVTIENRYESMKNIAIAEIKKYELTPREAEIWCLYRSNYSYKEIATKLHITLNTVKKHMKNIHAKRQEFLTNPN